MSEDLARDTRDGAGARILRGAGARSCEEALLAELLDDAAAARRDPTRLMRPLRVVVPSRSLRDHLCAALAARAGRAVAGIQVQTLHALAHEVLERAGEGFASEAGWLAIRIRQLAREERVLREELDSLADGYAVVEATVRDLLDAGLQPELEEAIDERLAEGGDRTRRGRACLRVACRAAEWLADAGLGHRSSLLVRARERLEGQGDALLHCRALFVHGFAEATGVVSDLLEALVRIAPAATVVLDAHPDAVLDPDVARDAPHAFVTRLYERLEGLAPAVALPDAPPPATCEVVEAPGSEAELRALSLRIRKLLDAGTAPGRIAVVARNLDAYLPVLRTHFERFAIPYSALSATLPDGARARRVAALCELLEARVACRSERWLDALADSALANPALANPALADSALADSALANPDDPADAAEPRALRVDLDLGFRALVALRLIDVAALAPRRQPLPLPSLHPLESAEESGTEAEARPALAPAVLDRARECARRTAACLTRWPERAPFAEHYDHYLALLDALGWTDGNDALRALADTRGEGSAATSLMLGRDDFEHWCVRQLSSLGRELVGGRGGGVALRSVMEARACTFEHLFVLGLNRDVFPRNAVEDPLLPDESRVPLRSLLPDIPVKATAYDEERYLFSQLISSARRVVVSWQSVNDEGKPAVASTFVDALRASGLAVKRVRAASLYEHPDPLALSVARPACEHALQSALFATPEHFAAVWRVALRQGADPQRRAGQEKAAQQEAATAARLALLAELEARPDGLASPYFGLVGPVVSEGDPRSRELWVTQLEALARCPWQYFVERLLRVEATPDPAEALPRVDALLLGQIVHGVLDRVARAGADDPGTSLDEVLAREGAVVAWPEAERLHAWLTEEVDHQFALSGLAGRGIREVAFRMALPYLARAREVDWTGEGAPPRVLGVEVTGRAKVGGVELGFRADRVDRVEGEVVLTDYKTGAAISSAKTLPTRSKHLLQAVARGSALQAAVYALAIEGESAAGRYLFLKPDLPEEATVFTAEAAAQSLREACEQAVVALEEARRAGAFPPRILESRSSASPCDSCRVKDACIRRDTGARHRLAAWIERVAGDAKCDALEKAALSVWTLGGRELGS